MRRTLMSVLTIGLLVAPATVDAQQPGPRRPHARPEFAGNPAARVLALPTVLELNARQIAQLEQIRDRANAQNQPLLAQLKAARPERLERQRGTQRPDSAQRRSQLEQRAQMEARGAEMQAKRQELQPILTQLRANAEKTKREVESVLTSQQLAKLQELESARRPADGRGGRGARGARPAR